MYAYDLRMAGLFIHVYRGALVTVHLLEVTGSTTIGTHTLGGMVNHIG